MEKPQILLVLVLSGAPSLRAAAPTIITGLQAGQTPSGVPIFTSPPVFDAIASIVQSPGGTLYVAGRTNSSLFPLAQSITPEMG